MTEIEWSEPPDLATINGKKPGPLKGFALALKDSPGRWAKVPETSPNPRTENGANSLASGIRSGRTQGFEAGAYDTAVDGTDVWTRYVGAGNGETKTETKSDLGKDVRAWAIANKVKVPERGRLPKAVLDAYMEAHPDEARTS